MYPTNRHLHVLPVYAGDLGEEETHEIELEPFPEEAPVQEPAAPSIVPEPEKVPA